MSDDFLTEHPDIEKLFERLDKEPGSLVFAPLADLCRKSGRLDEALEICSKGIYEHPEYASGYVVLGKCHYDKDDKEKAMESFQKVLSLDENNLVALKYLGIILVEKGNEEEAMEHFKHILALDPENTEIRTKLEDLQIDAGEADALEGDEDEEVYRLKGMVDEDFEGDTISLGDEVETSDEFATLTLADIYASQGYIEKAKKIYSELLSSQPTHALARKKLAALEGKDSAPEKTERPTAEEPLAFEEIPSEPEPEMEELIEESSESVSQKTTLQPRQNLEEPEKTGPIEEEPEATQRNRASEVSSVSEENGTDPDEKTNLKSDSHLSDTSSPEEEKDKPRMSDESSIQLFKKWIESMGD